MRVGFVGWRGMVGSVLMERMRAEQDFVGLEPEFFSTSQAGLAAPNVGVAAPPVKDAHEVGRLFANEVIVSCQGSEYTRRMLPALRAAGWDGYWIDAASAKRMDDDSVIILDPVNRPAIERGLERGFKNYIGGNCTVSLMLMALAPLFRQGWVEWITAMTYQAASGAGARQVRELVTQMGALGRAADELGPSASVLQLDRAVRDTMTGEAFPAAALGAPLAGSLLPWIDSAADDGQTREEWKGLAEGNRILELEPPVPIDGICVRIGAMRCHAQAFTIKLTENVPLQTIEQVLSEAHEWARVVPNERDVTLRELTPAAVSGTLAVPIGRLRKLRMGGEYLGGFSVGDQLLWGAAEPLRRMLRILRER